MTTTADPGTGAAVAVQPVTTPPGGLRHELRAVKVVWQRELERFRTDKARLVASCVQPLLFIFVLGKGLASAVGIEGGVDYTTFLFPGVVATGVMFTAVFSAITIVWDRELGFLREMLVAPISRSSIVVGKCLGGASVSTLQGLVLLALAGLVGVPYHPVLLLGCAGMIFLIAFAITAGGLVLAVNVKTVQTVMPLVQLLVTPLMFLSGSLFPAGGDIPTWLAVATRLNPLSYAVDAMRRLVLHFVDGTGGDSGGGGLDGALTWWGWPVPAAIEVLVVLATGLALLAVACAAFRDTE